MSRLETDSKRQAKDALRGYVYQILRSLLVWIDLGDRDELILEGAEDIDLIIDGDALVEQVKDTAASGPITLRTPAVRDAIGHFWEHRRRNPEYQIRYRYLTTAEITVEQGAPFGTGRAGLILWSAIHDDPTSPHAIEQASTMAAFLAADPALPDPVRAFCNAAAPSEVIDRLFLPMSWVVGQGDCDSLVRRIKDLLVLHGKTDNLPAVEAEKAFDPLYVAALEAARAKDGPPLTRAAFLRIFDAATSIQLRTQDFTALIQRAMAAPMPANAISIASTEAILENRPPLGPRYFPRVTLEAQFQTLRVAGPVVLQGSTGTGKTLLVASALRDEDHPAWVNLRDLDPSGVRARLIAVRSAVMAGGKPVTLVLEDLDGTTDPRPFESALSSLVVAIKEQGGQLIITSAHDLSSRLVQLLSLAPGSTLPMPAFEDDEISAFLQREGCPPDHLQLWSTIITATTNGHSQLVHARIAALSAAGFPRPSSTDLMGSTPDVDAVRSEARRLIAAMPDGPREMLYRVSLITNRVTRRRLMAVARADPPIVEPGTAIDIIGGPWLEKTDADEYRVSPLVRESAVAARGLPWARDMHGKISWVYLLERTITPLDITAILTHCLLSGSAGPLAYLMQSLFSASDEVWQHIAEASEMFAILGLVEGTELPFSKPIDLFIFRHFQYRIAVYTAPETAMRIAARFEQEAAAVETNEAARFFRFLFVSQLLAQTRVTYPMATLVYYTREFHRLALVMETSFPERLTKARLEFRGGETPPDYDIFIAYPLMHRIKDIDQITELLDALDGLPDPDIVRSLTAFAGVRAQSSLIIDRVWLAEIEKAEGRWPLVVAQFRRLLDLAVRLDITPLALAIAPSLVRTIDENLDDSAAAAAEAERRQAQLGDDAILMCAMAKVKKRAGQVEEALELWTTYLPRRTDEEGMLGTAYDYRVAASAAGGAGDWVKTESFLLAGLTLVDTSTHPLLALGMRMDAAFAMFMVGRHEEALERFEQVIASLEPLQADVETEPVLSLQRRIGGTFSAINHIRDGKLPASAAGNLAGFCSIPDRFDTDAPQVPPLDLIIRDLLELELTHAKALDRAKHYAARLRRSPYVVLHSLDAVELFKLATQTGDYTAVVADGVSQARAAAITLQARNDAIYSPLMLIGDADPDWPEDFDALLLVHIVVAMLWMASNGAAASAPVAAWRHALPNRDHARRARQLVNLIDGLFVAATFDPWTAVVDREHPHWAHHMLAALAATTEQARSPEQLLRCHGLWAHYCSGQPVKDMAGEPIVELVAYQWANMSLFSSELANPAGGIPALRRAIATPAPPWQRLKAILSAAVVAVGLAPGDTARAAVDAIVVEP
ncbi:hypothetical protein ACFB49_30510 [Sphingomonas sp. DBB INV C78]|uniref:hypothetical protein n=1 Tax=Sphingomonas sp. DBB INV C78 TaxID=3349434 RepID=UPI0036D3376F